MAIVTGPQRLPGFDIETWEDEWRGMPEYAAVDKARKVTVVLANEGAVQAFAALIGQKITSRTKEVWFPPPEWSSIGKRVRYTDDGKVTPPRYPVYIPSKGRWEQHITARLFEHLRIPYCVVVEPSEYEHYAAVIDAAKILVLPADFSKQGNGSIPARNWIWQHACEAGFARHWQLDDNIYSFLRLVGNARIHVASSAPFRCIEDFVDRYDNVALAGMNCDHMSWNPDLPRPPYRLNTRIYSMLLIDNALPYRFRGPYNEDTDLSLQALKGGWVTILFNAFIGQKGHTMVMPGGNTDTIYSTGDERRAFAESLRERHPDVVRVDRRFNRWHHWVDYSPFAANRLVKRSDAALSNGIDEYGMVLEIRKTRILRPRG